jgi:hypothetical protein
MVAIAPNRLLNIIFFEPLGYDAFLLTIRNETRGGRILNPVITRLY